MGKRITITEYSSFVAEKTLEGYTTLPQRSFDALEAFILSSKAQDSELFDLMSLSARKGVGKLITAKNYIGVIAMKDGTLIEILPKIVSKVDKTEDDVKKLIVDMLRTLKDSPYKTIQQTNVDIAKMNIFEIFIRMFIDEVYAIAKKGLKCDYDRAVDNSSFFKGKLMVSEHIRLNAAHRERSFVAYDEYNVQRPENRLIKAALSYLYRQTSSHKNKSDLRILLNIFGDVKSSEKYSEDFAKVVYDRNTADYRTALLWCRVFLLGKSFTSFSGSEVAFALLFPMEVLFESYVAVCIKKALSPVSFHVTAQDKSYHLFTYPTQRFLMKPDIVIRRKSDDAAFILDTKWKLLSDGKANYGILQSDMYQMYVYHKKYAAESVTLLYPLCEGPGSKAIPPFTSEDGVTVNVRFVDLFDAKNSIDAIVGEFQNQEGKTSYAV